jgi:aminopeptidase
VTGLVASVDPYLPERGDGRYRVSSYDLTLDYRVASNLLDGRARLTLVALEPLATVTLDLVGLRVSAATVGGRRARWRHRGAKLEVTPVVALAAGDEVVVDLRYRGNPGLTPSVWGPVGWEVLHDGALVAAQPSGACTWFPCNDLAAQKARYTVSIAAPTAYLGLANGTLRSTRTRGSTTTRVYEQIEPTSPYLMTAHVGRYVQRHLAAPSRPARAVPVTAVPVTAVHDPADTAAVDRAFARQGEMVALFEDRFGPYPFAAGYTVVICPEELEIPLEAQGQSIFGRNHLSGRHERLIAHELAHQWFGNSLTAATWRDIWLHEGFACYAEWLWSEHAGRRTADDLARDHHGRLRLLPADLVLTDPGPVDLFDDRVYKRGALTLHALRLRLGDGPFFDLLRRWTAAGRHGLVSTAGFEAMAADVDAAEGRSGLEALFDAWLRATAVPDLAPVTSR